MLYSYDSKGNNVLNILYEHENFELLEFVHQNFDIEAQSKTVHLMLIQMDCSIIDKILKKQKLKLDFNGNSLWHSLFLIYD